jgi:tRNA (guanine-N7-)-methyltransferase
MISYQFSVNHRRLPVICHPSSVINPSMTLNKLERFEENTELENVLEHTDYQDSTLEKPKGHWNHIFGNDHHIALGLACGTGLFMLELARRNPDYNYIGIDIKGARIWKGAKQAKEEKLGNVRFLRIFIEDLNEYFAPDEVHEIWITFADPYPRAKNRGKRLTSATFLKIYTDILQPGGLIHYKTDDTDFFNYTCRSVQKFGGSIIQKVDDIYRDQPQNNLLTIKTVYEKKHLKQGKSISYCAFTPFNSNGKVDI